MKKLKWGLIGCGDIARKRVAPALRDLENCELIAVSRARSDLVEAFAKEFGAKKWYANWRDLVNDDEIDAVYIATPVYLHPEQTIAAASAGKNVLCEKPMAISIEDCQSMIDACNINKVKLSIAYYRHFYPVIDQIKKEISSGTVGKIVMVNLNAFQFFDLKPEDDRYWLFKKSFAGGGPMMDFGCHRIEVLLNIFGPIKQTIGISTKNIQVHEVEGTATALFKFESGALSVLNTSRNIFERNDTLDIYGTEASIHVPIIDNGEMIIRTSSGDQIVKYPPHQNVHYPHIEAFTNAVIYKEETPVDGKRGKEVQKILSEIYIDFS